MTGNQISRASRIRQREIVFSSSGVARKHVHHLVEQALSFVWEYLEELTGAVVIEKEVRSDCRKWNGRECCLLWRPLLEVAWKVLLEITKCDPVLQSVLASEGDLRRA